MMERRRKCVSDLSEIDTDPESAGTQSGTSSSILERIRSPLLDRRAPRSTSTSTSGSSTTTTTTTKPHSRSNSSSKPPLKPVVEKPTISRSRSVPSPPSISRSRSAPFHLHHRSASGGPPSTSVSSVARDHAAFRSSPQYRANSAVVKFDERLLPVRMNYGIAGYNTSRRGGGGGGGGRGGKPHGGGGVVLRARSRNVRVVGLGLWTRRVLVRVMRTRVRSACSRLLMRFRRPRR